MNAKDITADSQAPLDTSGAGGGDDGGFGGPKRPQGAIETLPARATLGLKGADRVNF